MNHKKPTTAHSKELATDFIRVIRIVCSPQCSEKLRTTVVPFMFSPGVKVFMV